MKIYKNMAIPVYMQNFKHAGIYRVVFDKSTVLNQDTNVLRMVVGYSDKGPFNTPTYVQSASDFISLYGGINKTQERRGNFFHRTALQMLNVSPILCLNLKKFDSEKVVGAQIDTNFNAKSAIDTVEIPVADVYDTTRFWSLDPEKLNDVRGAEYINIATTGTKETSGTFFIRKAAGSKVSSYNVSVRDWYKDAGEDVPDYLQGYENELMSAFFAEVYVFSGKFTADQVLASSTLKNYFVVKSGKLLLKQYVKDSFGDYEDTLDYLYNDETSGAIGHYVGSLIPYFKDKNGNYAALDILFNQDSDAHNMMMSFNEDMLYEYGTANIDLSGARWISTVDTTPKNNDHVGGHSVAKTYKQYGTTIVCIKDLWDGVALTSLLGNKKAPVVVAKTLFSTSVWDTDDLNNDFEGATIKHALIAKKAKKISGYLYVKKYDKDANNIELGQIGSTSTVTIDLSVAKDEDDFDFNKVLYNIGAAYKITETDPNDPYSTIDTYVPYASGLGTYFEGEAYATWDSLEGPKSVITSLSRDLDTEDDYTVQLSSNTVKCNTEEVYITTKSVFVNPDTRIEDNQFKSWNVYSPSVTFLPMSDNWTITADEVEDDELRTYTLTAPATGDSSLLAVMEKGDQFLAVDKSCDMDGDGDYDDEIQNGYYDLCYVQSVETETDDNGVPTQYVIKFTGEIASYDGKSEAEDQDETISAAEYAALDPNEQNNGQTLPSVETFKAAEDKYPFAKIRKVEDGNGNLVDEVQYKWAADEYTVTYHQIGEYTVPSSTYHVLSDEKKANFVPSSITFCYVVSLVEYALLNDKAKALCTPIYGDDGVTVTKYVFVNSTSKEIIPADKATEAGHDYKDVIGADGTSYGKVDVTANPDININSKDQAYVLVGDLYELMQDPAAKADTAYFINKYTNKKYDFGVQVKVLTNDEFASTAPISDNDYQALSDDDKAKYESNTSEYTVDGDSFVGHYLVGYSDFVAYVYTYINKASGDTVASYQKYLVRIDSGLNQEIGEIEPTYLKGYTYQHPKPDGVGQRAKLDWQNYQLSALTEYKGLRTGLLNKSEIDYRYVIDGFETFVDAGVKKVLSYLCKEKQSAFCLANFPAVKTFVKCPYSSFTDAKGVFNAQYVVDGYNKKKAHQVAFSLPSNDEGASFIAFYSPLKFSDGTIDSVVPSAGLVSNLFMEKYNSRHPYEIVAGPNYGAMSASGMVGPDYNYSSDELNVIEPFGVNCMVYRPSFGTFINANQTAKQTPKSALSSVNVRELVIYLMDEVEKILQSYQWEFNNQTVRNKIKDRADAICARVMANGGIQAYLNVMDDSNNTADIIDNEMAVLSTHIEPGRGMGKMVHELTLYRTGQMTSTINGE